MVDGRIIPAELPGLFQSLGLEPVPYHTAIRMGGKVEGADIVGVVCVAVAGFAATIAMTPDEAAATAGLMPAYAAGLWSSWACGLDVLSLAVIRERSYEWKDDEADFLAGLEHGRAGYLAVAAEIDMGF